MAIDALVRPLLDVELFQGLKPLQITEIARRADRIVFKPGDVIVSRDTDGDAAILIIAGEAARVAGPGLPASAGLSGTEEKIAAGSLLGEMAMLIDTVHSSTIVARSAVRALRISRDELHQQMAADPELADHFVARISSRLSKLSAELRAIDQTLVASVARQSEVAAGSSIPTYH